MEGLRLPEYALTDKGPLPGQDPLPERTTSISEVTRAPITYFPSSAKPDLFSVGFESVSNVGAGPRARARGAMETAVIELLEDTEEDESSEYESFIRGTFGAILEGVERRRASLKVSLNSDLERKKQKMGWKGLFSRENVEARSLDLVHRDIDPDTEVEYMVLGKDGVDLVQDIATQLFDEAVAGFNADKDVSGLLDVSSRLQAFRNSTVDQTTGEPSKVSSEITFLFNSIRVHYDKMLRSAAQGLGIDSRLTEWYGDIDVAQLTENLENAELRVVNIDNLPKELREKIELLDNASDRKVREARNSKQTPAAIKLAENQQAKGVKKLTDRIHKEIYGDHVKQIETEDGYRWETIEETLTRYAAERMVSDVNNRNKEKAREEGKPENKVEYIGLETIREQCRQDDEDSPKFDQDGNPISSFDQKVEESKSRIVASYITKLHEEVDSELNAVYQREIEEDIPYEKRTVVALSEQLDHDGREVVQTNIAQPEKSLWKKKLQRTPIGRQLRRVGRSLGIDNSSAGVVTGARVVGLALTLAGIVTAVDEFRNLDSVDDGDNPFDDFDNFADAYDDLHSQASKGFNSLDDLVDRIVGNREHRVDQFTSSDTDDIVHTKSTSDSSDVIANVRASMDDDLTPRQEEMRQRLMDDDGDHEVRVADSDVRPLVYRDIDTDETEADLTEEETIDITEGLPAGTQEATVEAQPEPFILSLTINGEVYQYKIDPSAILGTLEQIGIREEAEKAYIPDSLDFRIGDIYVHIASDTADQASLQDAPDFETTFNPKALEPLLNSPALETAGNGILEVVLDTIGDQAAKWGLEKQWEEALEMGETYAPLMRALVELGVEIAPDEDIEIELNTGDLKPFGELLKHGIKANVEGDIVGELEKAGEKITIALADGEVGTYTDSHEAITALYDAVMKQLPDDFELTIEGTDGDILLKKGEAVDPRVLVRIFSDPQHLNLIQEELEKQGVNIFKLVGLVETADGGYELPEGTEEAIIQIAKSAVEVAEGLQQPSGDTTSPLVEPAVEPEAELPAVAEGEDGGDTTAPIEGPAVEPVEELPIVTEGEDGGDTPAPIEGPAVEPAGEVPAATEGEVGGDTTAPLVEPAEEPAVELPIVPAGEDGGDTTAPLVEPAVEPAEELPVITEGVEATTEEEQQPIIESFKVSAGGSLSAVLNEAGLVTDELYGEQGAIEQLQNNSVAVIGKHAYVMVEDDPETPEKVFNVINPSSDQDGTPVGARLIVIDIPEGTPRDTDSIVANVVEPLKSVLSSTELIVEDGQTEDEAFNSVLETVNQTVHNLNSTTPAVGAPDETPAPPTTPENTVNIPVVVTPEIEQKVVDTSVEHWQTPVEDLDEAQLEQRMDDVQQVLDNVRGTDEEEKEALEGRQIINVGSIRGLTPVELERISDITPEMVDNHEGNISELLVEEFGMNASVAEHVEAVIKFPATVEIINEEISRNELSNGEESNVGVGIVTPGNGIGEAVAVIANEGDLIWGEGGIVEEMNGEYNGGVALYENEDTNTYYGTIKYDAETQTYELEAPDASVTQVNSLAFRIDVDKEVQPEEVVSNIENLLEEVNNSDGDYPQEKFQERLETIANYSGWSLDDVTEWLTNHPEESEIVIGQRHYSLDGQGYLNIEYTLIPTGSSDIYGETQAEAISRDTQVVGSVDYSENTRSVWYPGPIVSNQISSQELTHDLAPVVEGPVLLGIKQNALNTDEFIADVDLGQFTDADATTIYNRPVRLSDDQLAVQTVYAVVKDAEGNNVLFEGGLNNAPDDAAIVTQVIDADWIGKPVEELREHITTVIGSDEFQVLLENQAEIGKSLPIDSSEITYPHDNLPVLGTISNTEAVASRGYFDTDDGMPYGTLTLKVDTDGDASTQEATIVYGMAVFDTSNNEWRLINEADVTIENDEFFIKEGILTREVELSRTPTNTPISLDVEGVLERLPIPESAGRLQDYGLSPTEINHIADLTTQYIDSQEQGTASEIVDWQGLVAHYGIDEGVLKNMVVDGSLSLPTRTGEIEFIVGEPVETLETSPTSFIFVHAEANPDTDLESITGQTSVIRIDNNDGVTGSINAISIYPHNPLAEFASSEGNVMDLTPNILMGDGSLDEQSIPSVFNEYASGLDSVLSGNVISDDGTDSGIRILRVADSTKDQATILDHHFVLVNVDGDPNEGTINRVLLVKLTDEQINDLADGKMSQENIDAILESAQNSVNLTLGRTIDADVIPELEPITGISVSPMPISITVAQGQITTGTPNSLTDLQILPDDLKSEIQGYLNGLEENEVPIVKLTIDGEEKDFVLVTKNSTQTRTELQGDKVVFSSMARPGSVVNELLLLEVTEDTAIDTNLHVIETPEIAQQTIAGEGQNPNDGAPAGGQPATEATPDEGAATGGQPATGAIPDEGAPVEQPVAGVAPDEGAATGGQPVTGAIPDEGAPVEQPVAEVAPVEGAATGGQPVTGAIPDEGAPVEQPETGAIPDEGGPAELPEVEAGIESGTESGETLPAEDKEYFTITLTYNNQSRTYSLDADQMLKVSEQMGLRDDVEGAYIPESFNFNVGGDIIGEGISVSIASVTAEDASSQNYPDFATTFNPAALSSLVDSPEIETALNGIVDTVLEIASDQAAQHGLEEMFKQAVEQGELYAPLVESLAEVGVEALPDGEIEIDMSTGELKPIGELLKHAAIATVEADEAGLGAAAQEYRVMLPDGSWETYPNAVEAMTALGETITSLLPDGYEIVVEGQTILKGGEEVDSQVLMNILTNPAQLNRIIEELNKVDVPEALKEQGLNLFKMVGLGLTEGQIPEGTVEAGVAAVGPALEAAVEAAGPLLESLLGGNNQQPAEEGAPATEVGGALPITGEGITEVEPDAGEVIPDLGPEPEEEGVLPEIGEGAVAEEPDAGEVTPDLGVEPEEAVLPETGEGTVQVEPNNGEDRPVPGLEPEEDSAVPQTGQNPVGYTEIPEGDGKQGDYEWRSQYFIAPANGENVKFYSVVVNDVSDTRSNSDFNIIFRLPSNTDPDGSIQITYNYGDVVNPGEVLVYSGPLSRINEADLTYQTLPEGITEDSIPEETQALLDHHNEGVDKVRALVAEAGDLFESITNFSEGNDGTPDDGDTAQPAGTPEDGATGDGDTALPSPEVDEVQAEYSDFSRELDQAGVDYWLNELTTGDADYQSLNDFSEALKPNSGQEPINANSFINLAETTGREDIKVNGSGIIEIAGGDGGRFYFVPVDYKPEAVGEIQSFKFTDLENATHLAPISEANLETFLEERANFHMSRTPELTHLTGITPNFRIWAGSFNENPGILTPNNADTQTESLSLFDLFTTVSGVARSGSEYVDLSDDVHEFVRVTREGGGEENVVKIMQFDSYLDGDSEDDSSNKRSNVFVAAVQVDDEGNIVKWWSKAEFQNNEVTPDDTKVLYLRLDQAEVTEDDGTPLSEDELLDKLLPTLNSLLDEMDTSLGETGANAVDALEDVNLIELTNEIVNESIVMGLESGDEQMVTTAIINAGRLDKPSGDIINRMTVYFTENGDELTDSQYSYLLGFLSLNNPDIIDQLKSELANLEPSDPRIWKVIDMHERFPDESSEEVLRSFLEPDHAWYDVHGAIIALIKGGYEEPGSELAQNHLNSLIDLQSASYPLLTHLIELAEVSPELGIDIGKIAVDLLEKVEPNDIVSFIPKNGNTEVGEKFEYELSQAEVERLLAIVQSDTVSINKLYNAIGILTSSTNELSDSDINIIFDAINSMPLNPYSEVWNSDLFAKIYTISNLIEEIPVDEREQFISRFDIESIVNPYFKGFILAQRLVSDPTSETLENIREFLDTTNKEVLESTFTFISRLKPEDPIIKDFLLGQLNSSNLSPTLRGSLLRFAYNQDELDDDTLTRIRDIAETDPVIDLRALALETWHKQLINNTDKDYETDRDEFKRIFIDFIESIDPDKDGKTNQIYEGNLLGNAFIDILKDPELFEIVQTKLNAGEFDSVREIWVRAMIDLANRLNEEADTESDDSTPDSGLGSGGASAPTITTEATLSSAPVTMNRNPDDRNAGSEVSTRDEQADSRYEAVVNPGSGQMSRSANSVNGREDGQTQAADGLVSNEEWYRQVNDAFMNSTYEPEGRTLSEEWKEVVNKFEDIVAEVGPEIRLKVENVTAYLRENPINATSLKTFGLSLSGLLVGAVLSRSRLGGRIKRNGRPISILPEKRLMDKIAIGNTQERLNIILGTTGIIEESPYGVQRDAIIYNPLNGKTQRKRLYGYVQKGEKKIVLSPEEEMRLLTTYNSGPMIRTKAIKIGVESSDYYETSLKDIDKYRNKGDLELLMGLFSELLSNGRIDSRVPEEIQRELAAIVDANSTLPIKFQSLVDGLAKMCMDGKINLRLGVIEDMPEGLDIPILKIV